MVAECFLPAPTDLNTEVDHWDGNPLNNHASNLRWVSKSVNQQNKNAFLRIQSNNHSGMPHHIYYCTPNGYEYYEAKMRIRGVQLRERFPTLEKALECRNAFIEKHKRPTDGD